MAKIVYGGGVAAASGKLAGQVFSRNKGGSYLRQFVKPTNPRSTYQEDARDRLTQFANEFRSLTEEQQSAWSTYAFTHPVIDRLGNSIKLSAIQQYVKVNINRDLAGDPATNADVPSDPAFTLDIIDVSTPMAIDISDTEALITLGDGAAEDMVLMIFCSPPVSAGVQNTNAIERFLVAHTLTAGEITAGEIDIYEDVASRFGGGSIIAGKKIICRSYEYQEGQLGAANQTSGIIAA